jgi:hypothetical protein
MTRRQERLWEQRVLLCRQSQRQAADREEGEQWRVKEHGFDRTRSWWRFEDDGAETRPDTTCWSSSCDRSAAIPEPTEAPSGAGSHWLSTRRCSRPTGSWKTLMLGKACNESPEAVDDEQERGGGRSLVPQQTALRAACSGDDGSTGGTGVAHNTAKVTRCGSRDSSEHAASSESAISSTPAKASSRQDRAEWSPGVSDWRSVWRSVGGQPREEDERR